MLASVVWYAAGVLLAVGAICVLRPIRRLGLPTRRRALGAVAGALIVLTACVFISPGVERITVPASELDNAFPAFHFNEVHSTVVNAPPDRVYRAMLDVTADELPLYRLLTRVRCLGRCEGESILNPGTGASLVQTALKTSFRTLAEIPNQELVFGTFVVAPSNAGARTWTKEAYIALQDPGYVKAAMNFEVRAIATGSELRTETRVFATDPASLRVFTAYWRTILPGSAIIRRQWLAAIKRRAENPGAPSTSLPRS